MDADADEVAEPYAIVAAQLIARVREDRPADVHRWLHAAMRDIAAARGRPGGTPAAADWVSLAVVLACAGRVDVPFGKATEWTWQRIETRRALAAEVLDPKPRRAA